MKEYSITDGGIRQVFLHRPEIIHEFDDNVYYYVNKEDWKTILSEIKEVPPYRGDRFDCDNFADMVRTFLALHYGLNGCGKAYGHIPEYHCFCVLLIPDGFICYEPQTGEFMNYPIEEIQWG